MRETAPAPPAGRELLLVLAVALAARAAYLAAFHASALFAAPVLDAAWYDDLARAVAVDGPGAGAPYFRAPLYGWLLGAVYAVLGPGAWAGRLLNAALGAGTALCVLLAGARLGLTRPYRVGAALAAALYAPALFLEGELLAEPLATFLVALGLVLVLWVAVPPAVTRRAHGWWFALGVVWALAGLARAPLAILIPWALGLAASTPGPRLRRVAWTLAGALLVSAGPAVLSMRAGGSVFPATHGGINFYIGNHAGADGRSVNVPGLDSTRGWREFADASVRVASAGQGRALSPAETSRWFWAAGLRYWREAPGAALLLTARKGLYLIHGFETANNRSLYEGRREVPWFGALLWKLPGAYWPSGLLFPLALAGLLSLRPRRAWFPVVGTGGLVLLPLVLFFVAFRFRVPALPVVVLLAALGARTLVHRSRPAWAVFLFTYALANLPWPGAVSEDPRGEALVRAEAALNAGRTDEAVRRYAALARLAPPEGRAVLGLAVAYENAGHTEEADQAIARAALLLPGYWPVEWCRARLLDRAGRPREAAEHLQAAVRDYPEHAELRGALGLTLEAIGETEAARTELERAAALGSRSAEVWNSVGRFRRLAGNTRGARAAWDRALRLEPRHFKALYNRGLLRAETGDVRGAHSDLAAARADAPDAASRTRVEDALARLDRTTEVR